tara:strand:- start:2096 stop:2737 length:642 start_codon:yes stop_codon:yes gene_type:complete
MSGSKRIESQIMHYELKDYCITNKSIFDPGIVQITSFWPKATLLDVPTGPVFMTDAVSHEVGTLAPLFNSVDSSGKTHELEAYMKEGKSVILYFYPRDSTPGCTAQACDFRDNMAQFQSSNTVVLGVSKDSERSHGKFIDKQSLNFPLLMDTEGELHELFGTWRMKKNYGREYMGCARSTFVIDSDGSFRWLRYNVKAKGHVGMLMRELGMSE